MAPRARKTQQKNNIKNTFLYIKKRIGLFTIAALLLVFLYLFFLSDRGMISLYRYRTEKENLENEIKKLEQKRENLSEEIDKLKNDPYYIEKIAREKYNMKKPQEEVFQVDTSDH